METKDINGDTFLHLSVKIDNIELVKYFISKNVNLNIKNKDGNTPLHLAVKRRTKSEVNIIFYFFIVLFNFIYNILFYLDYYDVD